MAQANHFQTSGLKDDARNKSYLEELESLLKQVRGEK